jgi:MFS family permease
MTGGMPGHHAAAASILPVITLAQFGGTSLWFAANAVMPDLQRELGLSATAVGTLTSAVQLGFIAGTLVFALLAIADRVSPRLIFLACSLAGAGCALLAAMSTPTLAGLVVLRVLTGFFLAGIYPVGMKIAASWYSRGLGAALGIMVAALVIGTASPHALRALGAGWPWQRVLIGVALLAGAGGIALYLLVPDATHTPRAPGMLQWRALGSIISNARVRASAFGYFGHMWELYALWVLVPAIAATRLTGVAVSWAAFAIIAAGAVGCAAGGLVAYRIGSSAKVAAVQIAVSAACCLAAPWMLDAPDWVFALWLAVWGVTVVGDSPQFSALTAANAPRDAVGSVLTLVNCIGFGVSIVSIELFVRLAQSVPLASLLPWLGVGPLLGLFALRPLLRNDTMAKP